MLENKDIVLFAYSGHSYVIIDALILMGYNVDSYFDQNENVSNPYGLKFLGDEKSFDWLNFDSRKFVFPAIGSNSVRKNLFAFFKEKVLNQCSVLHPKSIISPKVEIGLSTFVSAGVVINSFVKIGNACIINTSAIIEHECTIGDFTHIAPGAVLSGNVIIGSESFIGANSVIKQGVKIGDNVLVGAGAVVLQNIPDNEVWVGNPAKRIKI